MLEYVYLVSALYEQMKSISSFIRLLDLAGSVENPDKKQAMVMIKVLINRFIF